ncbi:response regulator [Curvibacter sp. RS43]|jgi:two-component system phosphate regulon response regulator PhoB|uniref:Response regulator n=1 Tax=Curvibacter microcysteis TaxID=3026419 RepID=A0ABT5MD19_9BURK|nr:MULTISPECIES: response regulator [unclassified Curvibacter]MDD0809382.1 response regulator [Curvibacter sp. RS43]MDD0814479.1 response regulator [Curvibacter sp. HBC28]
MKKILIVDDHADIRKLLRMTMEFVAYEIFEAADGKTGLAMAEELQPDLLLLDVMMPGGVDGLEVCRRVKANPNLAHAKVILLTARGQSEDRAAGFAAGADEYLVKPFSLLQLIETIHKLEEGTP